MSEAKFVAIIYASCLLLVGLIQVFVQVFSKKGYTLGVRLPKEMKDSEFVKKTMADFKFMTLALTAFVGLCQYFLIYLTQYIGILTIVFFLGLMILSLPLIIYNSNLKKISKDIKQDQKKIIAMDFSEGNQALGKKLILGYGLSLVLIGLSSLYLYINYDSLPDQLISQVDFAGRVTNLADKSYWSVFYPSLISLLSLVMFALLNMVVLRIRPRISQTNPQKSLENNKRAKEIWSYYLMANALVMTLLFELGVNMLAYKNNSLLIYILTGITVLLSIVGAFYIGIKVGSDGSKLGDFDDYSFEEDDRYWILGSMFYKNPNDPAVFVNKRIGVGMTINIGRPLGKVILLVTILIILSSLIPLFYNE